MYTSISELAVKSHRNIGGTLVVMLIELLLCVVSDNVSTLESTLK